MNLKGGGIEKPIDVNGVNISVGDGLYDRLYLHDYRFKYCKIYNDLDIAKFTNLFNSLVKDINTKNNKWKENCIGYIKHELKNYLNSNLIFKFELEVKIIGQSKIQCNCEYTQIKDQPKTISIVETVRYPNEICDVLISTAINSLSQKIIH